MSGGRRRLWAAATSAVIGLLWLAGPVGAASSTTLRVSVRAWNTNADGPSRLTEYFDWLGVDRPVTPDAKVVAFTSEATNLASRDRNGVSDVYVRDLNPPVSTQLVSVSSAGAVGNAASEGASIAPGGRYVVYSSDATNLVDGDTNGCRDVFLFNRSTRRTERVSVSSAGVQGNADSFWATVSRDGRYVVFASGATNLVDGDTNAALDVFLRDTVAGRTERVSVSFDGSQAAGSSGAPSISGDARHIAFWSVAADLVPGDTNRANDVFVRDRVARWTERVSIDSWGNEGNDASGTDTVSISDDGRSVAYRSYASNLVARDTNGKPDVFVHDRVRARTELVSVSSAGVQGNEASGRPSISPDGASVAFESQASNLVAGDTNASMDVFVRDLASVRTARASVAAAGTQAADGASYHPGAANAGSVVFVSWSAKLVAGDTNKLPDVFLRTSATVDAPGGSVPDVYREPE